MSRGAETIEILAEILAGSAGTLNKGQAAIDEGMALAVLVVAEADGKTRAADPERAVAIARGMLVHYPGLTSYLHEPAMRDGKPTRGGLLRAISGWLS